MYILKQNAAPYNCHVSIYHMPIRLIHPLLEHNGLILKQWTVAIARLPPVIGWW